jgi:hypothetical protein
MDQSTLIFAVHAAFAAALVGIGAFRITNGDPGGAVQLLMATGILGLGLFMARRRG